MANAADQHIPCIKCGYDLFAVAPNGNCTECGSAKALSNDPSRIYNVPLQTVRHLLLAVKLLFAFLVAAAGVLIGDLVVRISNPHVMTALFGIALFAALILAWNTRAKSAWVATVAKITCVAAFADLLLLLAYISVSDFSLPKPLALILFGLPLFGFHCLVAFILYGVPNRAGARVAAATAFCMGCCAIVACFGIQIISTHGGPTWPFLVYVVCAYGTVLGSLMTTVIAWISIKRVITFREQHEGEESAG